MSKRTIAIVVAATLLVASVVAIVFTRSETARSHVHSADVYYCPMHPTVTSDKPGNCPICGMSLVKRVAADPAAATALAESGALAGSEAVSLTPEQRITANVRTIRLELATHTGELITTGRVTFDERRMAQVTSYAGGRIERLFVNFTGDTVRRGQSVASIYSPDLYATQQEFLLALENRDRMRSAGFAGARSASEELVDSTRRRLLLMGMTAPQTAQLEKSRRPFFTTNVIAPVGGVVTRKLVVPQQYVVAGQPLFEVADLSTVWVEADVYEQQLPDIRLGQRVSISSPAFPGIDFPGAVSFIQPVIAGQTRTATVRIELANPRLQLKPDMYVSARIFGPPAPAHLMVPKSSVVDRGQRQFVWVETRPGTYAAREVKTGPRHGDQIVILSGLTPGDVVVVEGGFLLDSEAQLRGATSTEQHQGH